MALCVGTIYYDLQLTDKIELLDLKILLTYGSVTEHSLDFYLKLDYLDYLDYLDCFQFRALQPQIKYT